MVVENYSKMVDSSTLATATELEVDIFLVVPNYQRIWVMPGAFKMLKGYWVVFFSILIPIFGVIGWVLSWAAKMRVLRVITLFNKEQYVRKAE
jgi:hypothetical protein